MTARAISALAMLAATTACTLPPDGRPVSPETYDGSGIATVIATPFYALAKGAVCVTGAVLGGLSSAAVELTDRPTKYEQRASIHESMGANCRGRYYLPPSY